MVLPCVTSRQKQSATGIAKILWLRLVTGTDTQDNIYEDLSLVFKDNHDFKFDCGVDVLFQMKPELTDAQITNLKKHYSDERNLSPSEELGIPVSTDLSLSRTRRIVRSHNLIRLVGQARDLSYITHISHL